MLDPLNSLNKSLFYLHHDAIDYCWSLLQKNVRANRIYNLGRSAKRASSGEKTWPVRFEMGAFALNSTVKEMGDLKNRDETGRLCFKYEGFTAKDYLSYSPSKHKQNL